jgi:amphi-Trp domain-containing protein
LKELADRVETGSVVLKQGEQEVNLQLSKNISLEVKAAEKQKKKGVKHKLEVKLHWYEGDNGQGKGNLTFG